MAIRKGGQKRASIQPEDNPAVNLAQVLSDENAEVRRLSGLRNAEPDLAVPELNNGSAAESQDPPHPARFAVAFSGGGIRSAAVNLGVIQALAKAGILRQVHYMSGISGGGYILGWLTSWIRRNGFKEVQDQLESGVAIDASGCDPRIGHSLCDSLRRLASRLAFRKPRRSPATLAQHPLNADMYDRHLEPSPIRYLRQYTSYLTPRTGLGSGDTLAMVSIYLRNVLLNQTIIVCLLAGIIGIIHLLAPWVAWKTKLPDCVFYGIGSFAALVAIAAGALVGRSLNCLGHNQRPREEGKHAGLYASMLTVVVAACLWIVLPTALAKGILFAGGAVCLPIALTYITGAIVDSGWLWCPGGEEELCAVSHGVGAGLWTIVACVIAVAGAGVGTLAFRKWLSDGTQIYVGDWYVMLGLPAILLLFTLSSYLDIGIAGNALPDAKREWLGRLTGYYLYFAVIVGVVMIGALRGPVWMHLLFRSTASAMGGGKWLKWLLPGGWLFTVVSGLLAALSPKTGGPNKQGSVLDIVAKIAPPVFLAGTFLLVSWGVYTASLRLGGAPEYLTWVHEADTPAAPGLCLSEINTNGRTSVLLQEAAACAEKKQRRVWQLRGACISPANCPSTDQNPDSNVKRLPEDDTVRRKIVVALSGVTGITLAISILLSLLVDANEFSMHLFYRNRLVRAFLGASNVSNEGARTEGRIPSPFTGFAVDDDVPLQELSSQWPRGQSSAALHKVIDADEHVLPKVTDDGEHYDGPYPIWGTALNLTTGEDLAWQQRKAASFVYSPLYCGWDYVTEHPQSSELPHAGTMFLIGDCDNRGTCLHAYRATGSIYFEQNFQADQPPTPKARVPYTGHAFGPLVGTAMAASGAAISPNWGYHTSPAVAALLALFNIRIGWWTGNPRQPDYWDKYAPGAYYLITKELFGKADDKSRYVYLTDGGHFDNLGIYEMVRRRIRYIIACDADADPDYQFDDLANAVEKCRRDFGVEIEIDPSPIRRNDATHLSQRHFAVGTITYPPKSATEPAEKGILLYVKSSLTESDPADVLAQRNSKSQFPHDTTVNQFFNETQFEAYRALGENMIAGIWKEFAGKAGLAEIKEKGLDPENKARRELAINVSRLFDYLEKQYARSNGLATVLAPIEDEILC
jgi:hypothetical protein